MSWINELHIASGRQVTYDVAFERVIGHEGGLSLDREDRGNWTSGRVGAGELKGTKFGISAMSYPNEDIRTLTLERAKHLYMRDFWDRARAGEMDGAIAYQLFDAAVNHGVGNAVRMLQSAAGVTQDGIIGDATMDAVSRSDVSSLTIRFNARRLRFYTGISTFDKYGRGWTNRVADNLSFAAGDLGS